MRTYATLQQPDSESTSARIQSLIQAVQPEEILFCFAYATTSGFAEFQRALGQDFWRRHRTRWLISIDWGRTQPSALELLIAQQAAEVRIFDGARVVAREGFVPSLPYHPKAVFLRGAQSKAMLAGSGNFSRGGLGGNVECALSVVARADEAQSIDRSFQRVMQLWNVATPARDILAVYKLRWKPTAVDEVAANDRDVDEIPFEQYDHFWIEAGYVTQNRGPDRPGNQIDMPRGVHRFFGLRQRRNQALNSTIGAVRFKLHGDAMVERNLRLGNNAMEKITLPIPEHYGFGAYDGKILEFSRVDGGYRLRTYEPEEYRRLRTTGGLVKQMGSGRHLGVW